MKKTVRLLAMIIVMAMIFSMLPLSIFAAEEEMPMDIYFTGANYTSDTVTIDGVIDAADGYVCITPNGAKNTFVDGAIGYGDVGNKELNVTEPTAAHKESGADQIVTKYFVSQDDENVYDAIEQIMPLAKNTVDGLEYESRNQIYTNLKLGFNPADPTQQINLFTHGFYITQATLKTKWVVTYKETWLAHPLMVTGFVGAEEYTDCKTVGTDIIVDYVDAEGAPLDSAAKYKKDDANGIVSRTYEMKLNKAAIEAEYADMFDAEVDFGSMWLGLTQSDYAWAYSRSNYSLYWANGAIVDPAEYGVSFLPNMVVFDADPNAEPDTPEEPSLEFTSYWEGSCFVSGIGDCADMTEIVIPSVSPDGDVVEGIGEWALSDCQKIESIVIPETVIYIED